MPTTCLPSCHTFSVVGFLKSSKYPNKWTNTIKLEPSTLQSALCPFVLCEPFSFNLRSYFITYQRMTCSIFVKKSDEAPVTWDLTLARSLEIWALISVRQLSDFGGDFYVLRVSNTWEVRFLYNNCKNQDKFHKGFLHPRLWALRPALLTLLRRGESHRAPIPKETSNWMQFSVAGMTRFTLKLLLFKFPTWFLEVFCFKSYRWSQGL